MKLPARTPLRVTLDFPDGRLPVGRLAMQRGIAYLEYDAAFITGGLTLDPLRPPPENGLIAAEPRPFDGLHPMFADSLPDAWGTLLVRRRAESQGIALEDLSVLDRLAIVGSGGMGALVYEPETDPLREPATIDLDELATASHAVLEGAASDVLDELIELGESSGGARPKVLVGKNAADHLIAGTHAMPRGYEAWLVKFRHASDRADIAPIEAAYADMARAAGLIVSPTALLPARTGPGYFATKRFDRGPENERIHFASIAALLNTDYRVPGITYENLLQAVRAVTRDHRDVEAAYRRMAFNVLANNRDDHAKQHACLLASDGPWRFGPAYDLTFSTGAGGEHFLTVNGRGRDIRREDLLKVGKDQSIKSADAILDEVATAIANFADYAERYDVSKASTDAIRKSIETTLRLAG